MSRRKKALLVVLSSLALIVLLFGAAHLLLPRFVALAPVRHRIVTELSEQLGAAVEIRRLRLPVFPLPHVVLDEVRLSVPGTFDATIAAASVYPSLLALIRGALQPGRIQLAQPDVRVHLPAAARRAGASVDELRRSGASALAALASVATAQAPGLAVVLKQGSLTLQVGEEAPLRFTGINARGHLPPGRLDLDLHCGSSLWKQLSLSGWIDPATFKGSGRIEVESLRPNRLSAYFPPQGAWRLGDSDLDLGVRVIVDGPDALQADVHGSIAALAIQRGAEHLVLKIPVLDAALHTDAKTTSLVVSRLQSDYPRSALTGQLSLHETATLGLEATELDVAEAHEVARFFAPDIAAMRAVFDVLRGGHVSRLAVHARGRSLADLGRLDAITIHGQIAAGRVHVPGMDIDLDDVGGDVSVANGVLAGDRLAARWGKTRARAGSLQLGLAGEAPALAVQILADADAAEAFALLKRVARRGTVAAELDRFTAVEGALSGRLILEGTTDEVSVTADVSPFKVSARLEGLSDPLQIDGEHLLYEAGGVRASNVNLRVGASVLSRLAAHVDWTGAPSIEASSGPSRVTLEEVYPWLLSSGALRSGPWRPTALKGTVAVDSLRVSGPVSEPSAWRVELTGTLEQLEVDLPSLQRRLAIRYPLSLSDLRVNRDARQTAVSGRIVGPGNSTASVGLEWSAQALTIKELHVRDAQSDASLTAVLGERRLDLSFAGELHRSALDALVEDPWLGGWVRGDFRTHILADEPLQSTAQGRLEGNDVTLPIPHDTPLRLEHIVIDATGDTAIVDATLHTGADVLRVQGHVERSPTGFVVDADLGAEQLHWNSLAAYLPRPGEAGDLSGAVPWSPPLRGTLRITANAFTLSDFTWQPVRAEVALGDSASTVRIVDANLCGIATPGTITVAPDGFALTVTPIARHQPLDPALACLLNKPGLVTGSGDLVGRLTAHGTAARIGESLQGHLDLKAKDGRIYKVRWLAEVLSLLNVVTGWVESLPDVTEEGLAYDTLRLKGDLQGGTLRLKRAVLAGPSVKMVGEGSVDIVHRTIDVTLLVAPFRSIDTVVSHIPLINKVLGGSLVTVPVKVTGPLDDPEVIPLDPSAVGSELLGFMKRTLQLISPLWHGNTRK